MNGSLEIRISLGRAALAIAFGAGILVGAILGLVQPAGAAPGGVPAGAIIMKGAGGSCPAGYSTFYDLNGRFPRGATSAGSGGSGRHTHVVPNHRHSLAGAGTIYTGGASDHYGYSREFNSDYDLGSMYEHRHSLSLSGKYTSTDGSITTATQTSDSLPPYFNVKFCRKD